MELAAKLEALASELEKEAVDLVDVDMDDHGRQKPIVAKGDQGFFEGLNEVAQSLRELATMIRERV